jgi:hypothetical protein
VTATLYRRAALADGTSERLQLDVSVLVEDRVVAAEHNARLLGRASVRWIRDVGSPLWRARGLRPRPRRSTG